MCGYRHERSIERYLNETHSKKEENRNLEKGKKRGKLDDVHWKIRWMLVVEFCLVVFGWVCWVWFHPPSNQSKRHLWEGPNRQSSMKSLDSSDKVDWKKNEGRMGVLTRGCGPPRRAGGPLQEGWSKWRDSVWMKVEGWNRAGDRRQMAFIALQLASPMDMRAGDLLR